MTLEDAAVVRQPKPVPNIPENVLEQFSMKGKVVAITGASDGIGWAVAEAIAEAGGDLALWYNTNDAAISKGEQIAKKHGIRAKAYQVEVSDHEAVRLGVDGVVKDFGRLDVFVANAGMAISKAITEQTIEEYKKQMSVNGEYLPCIEVREQVADNSIVDGVVFCAKYAGAVFKSQGFGNLIITSSISAHIANVPVDQPVWLSFPHIVLHVLTSTGLQHNQSCREPSGKEFGKRMARFCKSQHCVTRLL